MHEDNEIKTEELYGTAISGRVTGMSNLRGEG